MQYKYLDEEKQHLHEILKDGEWKPAKLLIIGNDPSALMLIINKLNDLNKPTR